MVTKPDCSFFNLRLPLILSVLLLDSFDQVVVVDGKNVQIRVGLVMENTEDVAGKTVLTTLEMALSNFYAAHPEFKTRLVLHPRSSQGDIVTSASAVVDLIKDLEVVAIIGPATSMEAHFDISIGDKAHVPIISYSATSPFLSSISSDYFIQATQVDSAQVPAIASLIQAFGWRQVVPVYADNEYGGGIIPNLTNALQQIGTRIPYMSAISSLATHDQIVAELYKLKSMATRVFIVHMDAPLGTQLFSIAKKLEMMSNDYVWIITNWIGNVIDTLSYENIQSMQGVIGVRTYFPPTSEVDNFTLHWKWKIVRDNVDVSDPQITVFELWAYDAITTLAGAVEKVGGTRFTFEKANVSSGGSLIHQFGVSQVGQNLIRAIQGTRFTGLSGEFILINGQLQSSIVEIINVVGKGERTVGFWTSQNGFLKEMKSINGSTYSISKEKIGSIIWPGESKDLPKGWVLPVHEKKLKILVPSNYYFNEFVQVKHVPGSSTPIVTGYCIDVFDTVMDSLPYPVPYEYVPSIERPDRSVRQYYDEMISKVYYEEYDAFVADTTILANRSLYVDFTLPYTEGGLIMIAPIKDNNKNMTWMFVRPLSRDLWVTSFCYFVLFAFVIWVLEHPINPYFGGSAQNQVGVSLYYAFSTTVFAQRDHVLSNLARSLVIVWLFFALILTQSYTASLASMLTIKQLQPAVTGIHELVRTRKSVGYRKGSHVKDILVHKGFHDQNLLKPYTNPEELEDLLTKGSQNGGIAAAFDEIPYLKVFLKTHCSKYTMVPPTYKTGGFGFVFPHGSPLVDDVSRQILNMSELNKMTLIEDKWFGQEASCLESLSASLLSSNSLGLDSFRELFIITGLVAACALIVFVITFLCKNRQVWLHCDPNVAYRDRIKELARIFYVANMALEALRKGKHQNTRLVEELTKVFYEANATLHASMMGETQKAWLLEELARIFHEANAELHTLRRAEPQSTRFVNDLAMIFQEANAAIHALRMGELQNLSPPDGGNPQGASTTSNPKDGIPPPGSSQPEHRNEGEVVAEIELS